MSKPDNNGPDPVGKTSLARLVCLSIAALVFALSIRTFVFQFYVIPTSSMVPTLLTGDYVFVLKYPYGFGSVGSFSGLLSFSGRVGGRLPQRGEIIVFKLSQHSTSYIKRLIGLPGDRIQMSRGILYINGEPVRRERLETPMAFPNDDEPTGDVIDYIEYLPGSAVYVMRLIRALEDEETVNNTPEVVVPPHQYFFMGDNRDNSEDSRTSAMGFVPEENLVGKADFIFFSIEKSVHLWEFLKWPWAVRWRRLFVKIG